MLELSQLIRNRLKRLTRTLPPLEHGDVTGLHRSRIAVRRLRELLPILQLAPSRTRRLGRRLRKVTSRLGKVRELDVMLILIDELHVSRRAHRSALSRVGTAVSTERDEARRRLFEHSTIDELRKLVKRLDRVRDHLEEAEHESKREPRVWRWAIDARTVRRAARLNEAIEGAGAVFVPERLHDVRIALKKLRYVLEVAAEVADKATTPEIRLLKRAQDVLGRMHDRQVLIDRVRDEQAALTPPNVATWRGLAALVTALEDDCRRIHARYMRLRPEITAVCEKLSAPRRGHHLAQSSRQAG